MDTTKYAGFWVRFVAIMVDALVITIPVGIISSVALTLIEGTSGNVGVTFSLWIDLINLVIFWLYFSIMTATVGATLGKMLVGIRVRSANLERLSVGRVILRETVGKFISALILSVGYIMAAFTDKKRALHDMIAGSVVVYKNPAKPNTVGIIIATVIAVIIPIAIFALSILSSIVLLSLNDARQHGEAQQNAVTQSAPYIPAQNQQAQ